MQVHRLAPLLALTAWTASAQYTQQGTKFFEPNRVARQANSVAVSADGSTAILGGPFDDGLKGAAWIFTRTNGTWTQQGPRLFATDAVGSAGQGSAVALSADGNTAVVGGKSDDLGKGATWIYTRSNGVWTRQAKLFGTGAVTGSGQGNAVAISADGNTVITGGTGDNFSVGAFWVFTRNGNTWTQQGNKLVGTGGVGPFISQASALALSSDGSTAASCGNSDNDGAGAVWIFVRTGGGSFTQQGSKLTGIGNPGTSLPGCSVALPADGNTLIVGRKADTSGAGAAFIFTRSGTTWTAGPKLVGTGAIGSGVNQGAAVAISGDGNLAAVGGPNDNFLTGATWIFTRSGNTFTQQGNKLVGTGGGGFQGSALAISGDSSTLIVGGPGDGGGVGAAWAFGGPAASGAPAPSGISPASGSGASAPFSFTYTTAGGWQSLRVLNVLIRDVLDGRQACYIAFLPTGPDSGTVDLVDDGGNAAGPYAYMSLPGSNTISNQQCSIAGGGSSVSAVGNSLTLTFAVTFFPGFGGNKVVYAAAQDAATSSGWQPVGTWNVAGAPVTGPGVGGMTPGHTSGLAAPYTFTFTDTLGFQDIAVANVLVNSAIDGRRGCYLALVPVNAASMRVLLVDDEGNAGGPFAEMVVPGTGTVSNSQCTITGAGSAVSGSGNTLSLTLPITFSAAFGGNKVFYLAARSNTANSGWQAVGTAAVH